MVKESIIQNDISIPHIKEHLPHKDFNPLVYVVLADIYQENKKWGTEALKKRNLVGTVRDVLGYTRYKATRGVDYILKNNMFVVDDGGNVEIPHTQFKDSGYVKIGSSVLNKFVVEHSDDELLFKCYLFVAYRFAASRHSFGECKFCIRGQSGYSIVKALGYSTKTDYAGSIIRDRLEVLQNEGLVNISKPTMMKAGTKILGSYRTVLGVNFDCGDASGQHGVKQQVQSSMVSEE